MNTIARMRTINEIVTEVKQADPQSAVTAYFVRTLCKENKIRHFYTGKKVLVDLDSLIGYLTLPATIQNTEECAG